MSDSPEPAAPETDVSQDNDPGNTPEPTETVEHWREKARLQEKRAKENAAAAKRLQEIEDQQKTEAERTADRLKKADEEIASVPAKVASALREHLVEMHQIAAEDAELFLTATDPELLLKQVSRLVGQSAPKQKANLVPNEGKTPNPGKGSTGDRFAEFAESFFTR